MSQKSPVTIFAILFIASTTFLFWQNERALDPNRDKSWWTLSFAEPKNINDFGFTVENFSDHTEFQYEIIRDEQLIAKDTFTLNRSDKKTVILPIATDPDTRTSLVVTTGKEKKELYR